MGYLLVGGSLFAFVHPSRVYPDLIFLRLFFALGGSACVAMVTAILPQMNPVSLATAKPTNGKISGLAGFCTGVGALIAVTLFLPLPRVFMSHGWGLKEAIQASFYVVGTVALVISVAMFFGLKKDQTKNLANLFGKRREDSGKGYFKLMGEGFLAARDPRIALAYVGGLVARADSIVVSLFIPTVVSHYFVEKGLCAIDPHAPTNEIKEVNYLKV
jgi:MFS family permease